MIEPEDTKPFYWLQSIASDITAMTANMAAPILINSQTGVVIQTIYENDGYQVRQSIYDAVYSYLNGIE